MELEERIVVWRKKIIASFVNLCHYREKILNQVVAMVGTMCVTGEAVERPQVFD